MNIFYCHYDVKTGAGKVGDLIKAHFPEDVFIRVSLESGRVRSLISWLRKTIAIIRLLVFENVNLVYFTPSLRGLSSIRDVFTLFIIKVVSSSELKLIVHMHMRAHELPFICSLFYRYIKNVHYVFLGANLKNEMAVSKFSIASVLPNPVFNSLETKFTADKLLAIKQLSDRKKIVYIGYRTKAKGFYRFMAIARALNKLDVDFVFAGPSEFIGYRQEENIFYTGYLDAPEIGVLLRESTLFVLPSYSEAYPLSIMEALCSGCLVLATDVGEIRSLVGKAGFVGPWEFEQFTCYIRSVIDARDRFEQVSTALQQSSNLYSENDFINEFRNILERGERK